MSIYLHRYLICLNRYDLELSTHEVKNVCINVYLKFIHRCVPLSVGIIFQIQFGSSPSKTTFTLLLHVTTNIFFLTDNNPTYITNQSLLYNIYESIPFITWLRLFTILKLENETIKGTSNDLLVIIFKKLWIVNQVTWKVVKQTLVNVLSLSHFKH